MSGTGVGGMGCAVLRAGMLLPGNRNCYGLRPRSYARARQTGGHVSYGPMQSAVLTRCMLVQNTKKISARSDPLWCYAHCVRYAVLRYRSGLYQVRGG
eukprot:1381690-Rhodomonas_salina.6